MEDSEKTMFEKFCEFFNVSGLDTNKCWLNDSLNEVQKMALGFNELMSNYQGYSFGNGLYRMHKFNDINKWNKIVLDAFPEFEGTIDCFGYDWLGRQFSLDKSNIVDGQPQIHMFEPGTGEVYEIPCNFIQFHDDEIVNYNNDCLASEIFDNWMEINKIKLTEKECAGYKILLFLNGDDEVYNLGKSDLEVYWDVCGQLINKTKNMPIGTKIDIISIKNKYENN